MRFQGIEGLKGREPVGAVLRVGKKHEQKGYPVDRDRFYVCQVRMDGDKKRPLDPRFEPFNTAPLQYRRDVDAWLVHAEADDIHNVNLACFRPRGASTPPDNRYFCVGNGRVAERWDPRAKNGQGAFVQIPCPNDACVFRQKKHSADGCKPNVTLLFRPDWGDGSKLPTPLMRLDSRAWNTGSNLIGFFEHIQTQIDGLIARGVLPAQPSLYGFPFRISLREETSSRDGGKRFPVISFSPRESVADWLVKMAQQKTIISEGFQGLREIPQIEDVSMSMEIDPYAQRRIVSPASDGVSSA